MTASKQLRRTRGDSAFTLIEGVVTMVLILLVVTGMWRFRYESTLQAEHGQHITAAGRIANLLCQSWKTVKGATTFNPTLCNFDPAIVLTAANNVTISDDILKGFTPLGQWTVQTPEMSYTAILLHQNEISTPGLKILRVVVEWKDRRNLSKTIELCTQTNTN